MFSPVNIEPNTSGSKCVEDRGGEDCFDIGTAGLSMTGRYSRSKSLPNKENVAVGSISRGNRYLAVF